MISGAVPLFEAIGRTRAAWSRRNRTARQPKQYTEQDSMTRLKARTTRSRIAL